MRLLSLSAVALASACATASLSAQRFSDAPQPPESGQVGRIEAAAASFEAAVTEDFAAVGYPNLVVGVLADGKLAWTKGLGRRTPAAPEPPDARTVFRIGSVTKVFTGALVLRLRDEGKLDLDAPAARYLPELAEVVYPTRDSPPITVRHLVTHTSGLPRDGTLSFARSDREVTEQDVLAALRGARLDFAPGTRTTYSNLAMAAAGLVVARIAGEPIEQAMARHLFAPLGIARAAWSGAAVPEAALATGHKGAAKAFAPVATAAHWKLGRSAAMGGLYLDLEDFSRFAAFELSAWPPRGEPERGPLRRASVRESQLPAGFGVERPLFGVNWGVVDDPKLGHFVFHTGSTQDYSATIFLLPRRGLGVVAMTGCGEAQRLDALGKRLLELASEASPPPEPALAAPVEEALGKILALMKDPSEAAVQALFAPSMLDSVGSDKLLALFRQLQGVGACPSRRVLSSGERNAVVRVSCEKAALDLTMGVSEGAPHLVEGLLVRPAK